MLLYEACSLPFSRFHFLSIILQKSLPFSLSSMSFFLPTHIQYPFFYFWSSLAFSSKRITQHLKKLHEIKYRLFPQVIYTIQLRKKFSRQSFEKPNFSCSENFTSAIDFLLLVSNRNPQVKLPVLCFNYTLQFEQATGSSNIHRVQLSISTSEIGHCNMTRSLAETTSIDLLPEIITQKSFQLKW